jgi:ABC-type glutathione transport system ATPase component
MHIHRTIHFHGTPEQLNPLAQSLLGATVQEDQQHLAMSLPVAAPFLEMHGICKAFPGVQALDGVDLQVLSGEVHALLGETVPANRR